MNVKIIQVLSPSIQWDKLTYEKMKELDDQPEVQIALKKANEDYLHWEELRHKNWIPTTFFPDKELFWTYVWIKRCLEALRTPIRDANNNHFRIKIDNYNKFLHIVDKEMAGNFMGISDFSENDKRQFVARNIIEESIASSQLEGAHTSRAVAKKMLLEGRKPNNQSEQMIVNNHKTMLLIEEKLHKEKLSLDMICELHSMITEKTLSVDKQGKLRETLDEHGNRLIVKPLDDLTAAYITPDKEFVEAEIQRLIDFANNAEDSDNEYIHPLIKAIMLHFWIGLLHPFEDGNGRLARILFYWFMLRNEYWAFAYLSLSEKIKKSPKQYARAYIYSEQDDRDLMYFINYNIRKLKLAMEDFKDYIKNKVTENRLIISLGQQNFGFNERQIKLLQYFNRKMEDRTNVLAHQKFYSIKKGTAINDLKILVEKNFLIKRKFGRNVFYYPTEKISQIFNKRF